LVRSTVSLTALVTVWADEPVLEWAPPSSAIPNTDGEAPKALAMVAFAENTALSLAAVGAPASRATPWSALLKDWALWPMLAPAWLALAPATTPLVLADADRTS
jgi:hypothetical protein